MSEQKAPYRTRTIIFHQPSFAEIERDTLAEENKRLKEELAIANFALVEATRGALRWKTIAMQYRKWSREVVKNGL